jgi:type VI secretion system protein ImpA
MYASIRQAREEEDASLPMGDWDRPLKKADWKAVEQHAIELLSSKSKDFQVAAWLVEAWVHRFQINGLIAGIDLLHGLTVNYWAGIHPRIENSDDDARAAPFVWINENLSRTLLLKLVILNVPDCVPSIVSLAQWEQTLVQERNDAAEADQSAKLGEKPLSRERIVAAANGINLTKLIEFNDKIQEASKKWLALTNALDLEMKINPPSIARVGDVINRIGRVANGLIDGRLPTGTAGEALADQSEGMTINEESPLDSDAFALASPSPADAQVLKKQAPHHFGKASFSSREEAYRHLEAIASFLQEMEPHSPTPYLVRRAVNWGRMSLADLMQDILREEGDVNRFFSLLGVGEEQR